LKEETMLRTPDDDSPGQDRHDATLEDVTAPVETVRRPDARRRPRRTGRTVT